MPDRLVMSSHAQATDGIARAVAAAALATPAMIHVVPAAPGSRHAPRPLRADPAAGRP
jgi:hypothetical protein